MDLGIPTLIETKSIEECAALCSSLHFQFVELNMNLPEYQPEQIDAARFRKAAEKYGIYYTIHLDENLNPCDFNERVARAYTETALRTIELAGEIDAPILNMHMAGGVYFTLPERRVYLFEEYREIYLQRLKEFRDKCAEAAGDLEIRICIENPIPNRFQREGVSLLLESPVFGLTFDIGHNAGIGGVDAPYITEHEDRLCHMHIHDFRDGRDHLPLGEGELDLESYFALGRRHGCRAVLETKTAEGLWLSKEWLEKNREK